MRLSPKLSTVPLLDRLDDQSRRFVHGSAIRLGWYAGGTVLGWLIFTSRTVGDLAANFQLVCMMGAIVAVVRAFSARSRVNTPSLNDWDEGMLLNLLGLGTHMSRMLLS